MTDQQRRIYELEGPWLGPAADYVRSSGNPLTRRGWIFVGLCLAAIAVGALIAVNH